MTNTPLRITVLGPPSVRGQRGSDPPPVRARSIELLVYLIAADGDAAFTDIADDLLPDVSDRSVFARLHTIAIDLRRYLAAHTGRRDLLKLTRSHCTLDRDLLDVDLWRLRSNLALTALDLEPDQRLAILRESVDLIGGELADGQRYDWAAPHEHAIRRQSLEAHLQLAHALAPSDTWRRSWSCIGRSKGIHTPKRATDSSLISTRCAGNPKRS